MKQIMAVIQPHMLNKVEYALHAFPHFPGFTLFRVTGHGRGRAPGHAWHPTEWDLDEQDKVALLILCSDELAVPIVDAIQQNAQTGRPGDGLIVLTEVAEVVRIRTGERGENAV